MADTVDVWNSSPLWEAARMAISASVKPYAAAAPDSRTGKAWTGFMEERANIKTSGFPAEARTLPVESAMAIWPRCRLSTSPPRVTWSRISELCMLYISGFVIK
ncbi:hypothetical protein D3C75_1021590 [compost metagenome]